MHQARVHDEQSHSLWLCTKHTFKHTLNIQLIQICKHTRKHVICKQIQRLLFSHDFTLAIFNSKMAWFSMPLVCRSRTTILKILDYFSENVCVFRCFKYENKLNCVAFYKCFVLNFCFGNKEKHTKPKNLLPQIMFSVSLFRIRSHEVRIKYCKLKNFHSIEYSYLSSLGNNSTAHRCFINFWFSGIFFLKFCSTEHKTWIHMKFSILQNVIFCFHSNYIFSIFSVNLHVVWLLKDNTKSLGWL